MAKFDNRVFGCVVVKAINSNYNADFSGQPRTLPSGIVYASDKALKYATRNYMRDVFPKETIFYFKTYNQQINPLSMDEAYIKYFGDFPIVKIKKEKKGKKEESETENVDKCALAKNLLSCIDIRLFGATFACSVHKTLNVNLSLHGPVQVNHGVNIWSENNIFTEQMMSPFRNKDEKQDTEKEMTTIGRQSKLEEGHYLHHFSINPHNLDDIVNLVGEDAKTISVNDIEKLKEAMKYGVTWYDSASKVGSENEMLIWIQLKKESKAVLPNMTSLIKLLPQKENGKYIYDLELLSKKLLVLSDDIEFVEIFYNKEAICLKNIPEGTKEIDL